MCSKNQYKHFEERLVSFTNWKGAVKPLDLALAGFYYTECDDIVRCFHCRVGIYRWKVGDIPISDHLMYSEDCSYVKLIKDGLLKIIEDKKKHKHVSSDLINYRRAFWWLLSVMLSLHVILFIGK